MCDICLYEGRLIASMSCFLSESFFRCKRSFFGIMALILGAATLYFAHDINRLQHEICCLHEVYREAVEENTRLRERLKGQNKVMFDMCERLSEADKATSAKLVSALQTWAEKEHEVSDDIVKLTEEKAQLEEEIRQLEKEIESLKAQLLSKINTEKCRYSAIEKRKS